MDKHRGGKKLLLYYGGKDATKEFYDLNHTKKAQKILESDYIRVRRRTKKLYIRLYYFVIFFVLIYI